MGAYAKAPPQKHFFFLSRLLAITKKIATITKKNMCSLFTCEQLKKKNACLLYLKMLRQTALVSGAGDRVVWIPLLSGRQVFITDDVREALYSD